MTQPIEPSRQYPDDDDQALEIDTLISRLVDGEASAEDRERFERLAEANPSLWRQLARAQLSMQLLEQHVDRELRKAEWVDLPFADDTEVAGPASHAGGRWQWAIALSGWAALIALAIIWSIAGQIVGQNGAHHRTAPDARPASESARSLSYDQHLDQYLRAPFVLGELPATLLEVERMSDGRYAVRILRRIEEIAFVEDPDTVPLDEQGNLIAPPSTLRDSAGESGQPH